MVGTSRMWVDREASGRHQGGKRLGHVGRASWAFFLARGFAQTRWDELLSFFRIIVIFLFQPLTTYFTVIYCNK